MKKYKNKLIIIVLLGMLLTSSFVFAKNLEQNYPDALGTQLNSESTLPDLIAYLYNFAIMIAGLAVFFMLVIGGFKYLSSAGDPGKTKDAKDQLTSSMLGLILLLSSYLILNTINPQLTSLIDPEERIRSAISGVMLSIPTTIQAGQIALYENPDLQGELIIISTDSPISNLSDFDHPRDGNFDERISSVELGENILHAVLCIKDNYEECVLITTTTKKLGSFLDDEISSAVAGGIPGRGICQGVTFYRATRANGVGQFFFPRVTQRMGITWIGEEASSLSMEGSCVVTVYAGLDIINDKCSGDNTTYSYNNLTFTGSVDSLSPDNASCVSILSAPLVDTKEAFNIYDTDSDTVSVQLNGKLTDKGDGINLNAEVWFQYRADDYSSPTRDTDTPKSVADVEDGVFSEKIDSLDPGKKYLFRAISGIIPNKLYSYGEWVSFISALPPQCDDNMDNDGDDKIDAGDPECLDANGIYDPDDTDESS